MSFRRVKTALFGTALLVAGIAIGLAIPRAAHQPSPGAREAGADRVGSQSPGRDVYALDIRHDDYVRREQAKLVEMLEQQCRASGENCELAKASRRALATD